MMVNLEEHNNDPYQTDGGRAYHDSIYGGVGPNGLALLAERRASKIQPHVLSTDNVLEFGVGPGWNLARVKAKTRTGYDVATIVKPIVEAHGIVFRSEISKIDEGFYDVVICSHVLEHLVNPFQALTTILNCMKPSGKALFFLPFDVERKFRKYDKNEPNFHLYSWNVQSFANLLNRHGYTIKEYKIRLFGYERIIAIWVERYNLPNWMYSVLLKIALFVKPSHELAFVAIKTDISTTNN